ncbi:MAG: Lipid A export ATP-binding/permease protein MsbA [Proteobacteria bacterium]|nr:MAG: Lipid A export ATP-binding/permease protein MsbA [Pseudomonadota bacterium]
MLKKYKDKLKNNYTVKQLVKIWPYVRPYKGRALLALLLAAPLGALDAVIAWSLKPFMDNVLIEKSVETAMYVPLVIIGFSFIQALLSYAVNYLNAWVGGKITNNLRSVMYQKLMGFESKLYDKMGVGNILVRFNEDVALACSSLLSHAKLIVVRFFSSISLLGVLIYHSWQLAIVAIGVLILAFYPLKTYRRRIKSFTQESIAESGNLMANYTESVNGHKVVKTYNLEDLRVSGFEVAQNKLFRLGMKMTQRTAFLPAIMGLMISCGVAAVIWYGSYLIVNDQITGGEFVSFIAALIMLYNPLKRIGNSFASFQASLLAMERLFELYEKEYLIKDTEKSVELTGLNKSIELKNVNFSYEEGVKILKDISLTAEKGQTVALVGNSGGGKSTVVSLLPRLYDVDSGEVLIDGKNIKDYTLYSLRENISVVLQDNFLFNGTVRENLTLGKEYAEEDIMQAIKSACLEDFINDSEDGLDTQVGANGSALSGGQRQRVSIARAFLKNAPILILDEATSALDNKSEKVVQAAMENLMKDRTVFVIAHRLTTIHNADKIVVLNDGRVMEEGGHKELLNKNGHYASLYNSALS